jgi:hypothetical protein
MAAVASSAPGDPPTETGSIAADTALVLPAAASPVASPGASAAVAPDAAAPAAAATAPDAAVAGAGALPAEESALPPATAAASDSSHGSLLPFIPLLGVGMFLALTGGGNGSDLGLPPDVGGTPPAGSPPGGGPPPIITPPIVPPVTTTPEPATMVLIASGLGALGAARTRRRGK